MSTFLVIFACSVFGCVAGFNITFLPSKVEIHVDARVHVDVLVRPSHEDEWQDISYVHWTAAGRPKDVVEASIYPESCEDSQSFCNLSLSVKGLFLGFGRVQLSWMDKRQNDTIVSVEPLLEVTVLREEKVINKVFTAFVATVVSLNNINMGCALDIGVVKNVLRKPIAPVIGFFCQFVIMPLVSYASGYLLLEDPVLRFGLFTLGSSPAGGASNMWTVLLGGNLDLSITMTFISSVAALGTVPLWLLTLGKTILTETHAVVPYGNILASLASLIVPIGIGLFIQRKFPKVAAKSKRLLAPICIILLICIIIMASISNLYMFYMLTWSMVAAAGLTVWTGFIAGAIISWIFRFSLKDILAISVETGIQNSGIAFVLLSYSLKPPLSDMASVVPVAASIITPIPLFIIYCYQRLRNRCCRSEHLEIKALTSKSSEKDNIIGLDNPSQSCIIRD